MTSKYTLLHHAFIAILYFSFSHASFLPATELQDTKPTQAANGSAHPTNSTPAIHGDCGRGDIIDALFILGYSARALPDGRLVALDGDVGLSPKEVLSQTELCGDRSKLWRTKTGRPLLRYRLYKDGPPAITSLSFALSGWIEHTCLQAVRLPDGDCRGRNGDGEPTLCVGNFTGCWSYVGQATTGAGDQPLSLEPGRCGLAAAAHQLGHLLGLQNQHQRPDRHQVIRLRPEHSPLRRMGDGGYRQAGQCRERRLAASPPPAPYDFLSVMQLRAAAFADEDQRPVLVAKDGRNQHLLDYHVLAGLRQSHFDLYTVNKLYGCQLRQRKTCAAFGWPTTRCRNFGYLTADCRCRCPPEYSGSICEHRNTAAPSLPHSTLVEVTTPQTVELSDRALNADPVPGARLDFQYVQFVTITAIAPSDSDRVSVSLRIHPSAFRPLAVDPRGVASLIANLPNEHELLLLLWDGSQHAGLRAECFSYVCRNESRGPVLRGRSSRLDMTISSGFGRLLRDPHATVVLLEAIAMKVEFLPRPEATLILRETAPAGHTADEVEEESKNQDEEGETEKYEDTKEEEKDQEEKEDETEKEIDEDRVNEKEEKDHTEEEEEMMPDGKAEKLAVNYGRRLEPGEKLVVAVGGMTLALLVALFCFVFANFVFGENRRAEQRR
ncbi:X-linked retinitis pigmentosa GTPase regulator-interacting protein 1-like [Amphibalanus amphitrite]|uniref:X-linked retinitis pigmentosa GTPase regulator-interacting protein 1-like n=1 Tax=Amphibalanus amphitrite TaxID=1232801 RepID=UPI001C922AE1|nr:X-linked retinitis pigmentosa GTPase regulator-interacting protein 1-like [Amphibalanus amphitrite]